MSYQEKKTIASIVSGILLLIAYCIYAYSKLKVGIAGEGEVTFWAKTMLLFIVIGVGFVMALVTYLFNSSVVALLQILFFAFALGSILEGVLQIYYYRKGV